jgi:hypothetical protein
MKNSNWLKLMGTGVLALTIAFVPFTSPTAAQVTGTQDVYEDDGFDWDLLGLLGLLGLAGLAGKGRNSSPTVYRDPNSPGSNY